MCCLPYLNPEIVKKLRRGKVIATLEELEEAGDEHFLCRVAED